MTSIRIRTTPSRLGLPHLAEALNRYVQLADEAKMGYLDLLDLVLSVAGSPRKDLQLIFGMVMYEADPAVIKAVLADAPLPARLILAPHLYASHARKVHGTSTPPWEFGSSDGRSRGSRPLRRDRRRSTAPGQPCSPTDNSWARKATDASIRAGISE